MQFIVKTLSILLLILVLVQMVGTVSAATVNTPVIEDASISSSAPDTNYGDLDSVQTVYNSATTRLAFFKFNITDYPATTTLYLYQTETTADISTLSGYFASSDWSESNITWNSGRPSTETELTNRNFYQTTPGAGKWMAINLTDHISEPGTYTVFFRMNYGYNVRFNSTEAPANLPYVSITTHEDGWFLDEIYVNNTHASASDENNGTVDFPFETITGAITRASPVNNSIINIYGDYSESINFGREYKNLTVIGYDSSASSATHAMTFEGAKNITIQNMNISTNSTTSAQYALYFAENSGSYINIVNCDLNAIYGAPVYFAEDSFASFISFDRSIAISDAGYPGYGMVFSNSGSHASDIIIKNGAVEALYSGDQWQEGIIVGSGTGDRFLIENMIIRSGKSGLALGTTNAASDSIFSGLAIYASLDGTRYGSGMQIQSGDNNTFKDSDIYYAKYTGVKPNRPTNTTIHNITLHSYPPYQAYTHNAVEIKGNDMHFYDLKVFGYNDTLPYTGGTGPSYHVFYGAGAEQESHILVEDCYSNDTIDRWIGVGGHQENVIFRNMTGVNHDGQGIYIVSFSMGEDYKTSDKLVFDNISLENALGGSADYNVVLLSLGSSRDALSPTDYANISRENITFIDTNFTGTNTRHWWMVDDGAPAPRMFYGDIYAFNPSHTTTAFTVQEPSRFEGVLHFGYYPNIKVVNPSGQAVEGATVSFVSNATNPETGDTIYAHNIDYGGVEKAYTDTINSSLTLSDGELPNRYENATGAVALTSQMRYYTSSPQTEYVEWNVTATYGNESNSTIITPDMLRYSPDSSDIQSDEVVLILDVEGTDGDDDTGSGGLVAIVGAFILAAGYFWNRRRW
ncbi:DNRLRE domain-containing protein [Methanolobus sp. WCC5]|uniref:DNRLRE domain-containing protein n=1 Tax=Methanolobus sp. WCC5 TaxID=3125785 RepID=UPI00324AFB07